MTPPDRPAESVEGLLAHVEGVRRLSRALVRDEHDADDVAQESLRRAVEAPPARGWPLGAWLRGVVRNVAREKTRGDRRRTAREAVAARPDAAPADADLVARVEMQRKVLAHVLALEPAYRTVVVLRYVEGLPASEVARLLDEPLETVRTRLKRALERLRATLDAEHGGRRGPWAALLPLPIEEGAFPPAIDAIPPATAAATAAKAAAVLLLAGGAAVGAVIAFGGRDEGGGAPAAANAAAGATEDGVGAASLRPASDLLARADGGGGAPGGGGVPVAGPEAFTLVDRDLDLHGVVVREDGSPVAGATLVAVEFPWRRMQGAGAERNVLSVERGRATSAADGSFALRLERGSEATLRAVAPGLARADVDKCQAGQRIRVTLKPATVLLVTTRDEAGSPVGGARVDVWREVQNSAQAVLSWTGRTDAKGLARFEEIEAGTNVGVGARREGFASPDTLRMRVLSFPSNEVSLAMPAGRTIAGRVVDAESRAPVAGARLATDWSPGTWWVGNDATSGADGRFEIVGWSATTRGRIVVDAPGYVPSSFDVPAVGAEAAVSLARGSDVVGRVVGPDGAPRAGARVAASTPEDWTNTGRGGSAGTDGRFRLEGLVPGKLHSLTVEADGLARTTLDFRADAKRGSVLDLGDVRVGPPRRIEGRILTDAGEPVPDATVWISGGNPDRGRLLPGTLSTGIDGDGRTTDDLGRFRFARLGAGPHAISARTSSDAVVGPKEIDLAAGDVLDVELRVPSGRPLAVRVVDSWNGPVEGAPFEVRAKSGAVVRGSTDARGRAGVQVPDDASALVVVEAWAREHGFRAAAPVTVPPPTGGWPVSVVLDFDGEVSGVVLGPDGEPLVGAYVLARAGERRRGEFADRVGRFRTPFPPGVAGTLALTGLVRAPPPEPKGGAPSKGSVGAQEAEETLPIEASLEGVRAGASDLVLRARALDVDRVLRAVVLDPDGKALAGARVAIEGLVGETTTDEAGRAALEGLPARSIRVVVLAGAAAAEGHWCAPFPDTLVPDGNEVVLRMRRAARVEGLVVDGSGGPVPGSAVHVTQAPQSWTTAMAGDDGRFVAWIDPDRWFPVTIGAYRAAQGRPTLHGKATLDRPPTEPVTLTLSPP